MNDLSKTSVADYDVSDRSSQYPILTINYDSRMGEVTPWDKLRKVSVGDVIKLKFNPHPSYLIEDVRICDESLGPISTYSLNITKKIEYNVEVIFKFKEIKVNIKSNNEKFGTTTKSTSIQYGSSTLIEAIPISDKYRFVRWTNEFGDTISLLRKMYTPVSVMDRTYIAEFEEVCYNVIVKSNIPNSEYKLTTSNSLVPVHGSFTASIDEIAEGYNFTNWSSGNFIYSSDPSNLVINDITSDIVVTANFSKVTHTISATSYPSGLGVISVSNSTPSHGDKVILNTTVPIGYMVTKWIDRSGHTVGRGNGISVIANSDMDLIANFEPIRYSLTLEDSDGGVSKSSIPTQLIEYNRRVVITATPNIGYHFVNMTEGSSIISLEPKYVIGNMTRNRRIKSNYEVNRYVVSVNDSLHLGSIARVSNTTPNHGETVVLSADKDVCGNTFSHWVNTIDNSIISNDSTTSITVTSPMSITAVYSSKSITVKVNSTPNIPGIEPVIKYNGEKYISGESFPNYSNIEIELGRMSSVVNKEYCISNYYLNGEHVKSGYSKLILPHLTTDSEVTIECSRRKYRIMTTCNSNHGTVLISNNEVHYNDQVTITATPKYGYEFSKWINNLTREELTNSSEVLTIDEKSLGRITSFNSHPTLTLTAIFTEMRKYKVIAQCNIPGSGELVISKSNPYKGESVTISHIDHPGYQFLGYLIDDQFIEGVDEYTIDSVTSNISVMGLYRKVVTITTSVTPSKSGRIQLSESSNTIQQGSSMTLTAKNGKNYRFFAYKDESGNIISRNPIYCIDSVNSDMSITAEFRKLLKVRVEYDELAGKINAIGNNPIEGESVTLTAVPNDDYLFEGYYNESGEELGCNLVYNTGALSSDLLIYAKFVRK